MINEKKQITLSMEQPLKVLEDIKVSSTTVVAIKYNVDKSTQDKEERCENSRICRQKQDTEKKAEDKKTFI